MKERTLPVSVPCPSVLRRTAPSAGISMGSPATLSRTRQAFHSSPEPIVHPPLLTTRPAMQKLSRWMEDLRVQPPNPWPFRLLCQPQVHYDASVTGNVRHHGTQHVSPIPVSRTWILPGEELAFRERFRRPVPGGVLQHFNHPNLANPYGGQNGFGSMILPWVASDAAVPLPTSPPPTPPWVGRPALGSTRPEAYVLIAEIHNRGRSSGPVFVVNWKGIHPVSTPLGHHHPARLTMSLASSLGTTLALILPLSFPCFSQQRAERTIDEIKIEAVHRAEVGTVPAHRT